MNRSTLPIVAPPPVSPNITNATTAQAASAAKFLEHFINPNQLATIRSLCRGEEGQFFKDKLCELAAIVAGMPEPYGTNGQGENAIAWLRYFAGGSASWLITEKDNEDPEEPGQHQAHGLACLYGEEEGGERGYISIAELLANNAEIDLHFTPCSLRELREKREGRKAPALPPAEAAAVAEFDQAPAPIESWDKPKAAYQRNDRGWIPATWKFFEDMLEVVPPVYGPTNHGFGLLFGVGEPWNHTRAGEEVLLWFRNLPGPACRLATKREIEAEVKGGK